MTFAMLRFQRIYQLGCLACRRMGYFSACQVHHLNLGEHAGQRRLGDEHTIGLCPWHHVGEPIRAFTLAECRDLLGPSMKHEPRRFREFFGSDAALLAWQNELIQRAESILVGRPLQLGVLT